MPFAGSIFIIKGHGVDVFWSELQKSYNPGHPYPSTVTFVWKERWPLSFWFREAMDEVITYHCVHAAAKEGMMV